MNMAQTTITFQQSYVTKNHGDWANWRELYPNFTMNVAHNGSFTGKSKFFQYMKDPIQYNVFMEAGLLRRSMRDSVPGGKPATYHEETSLSPTTVGVTFVLPK